MPLPLIPILIGAGAAALGVGKGIKAAVDNSTAKDVNQRANSTIQDAKKHLELCREKSKKSLEALGGKKLFILDKGVMRFITVYEKLQNVDFKESAGLDELNKFRLDKQSVAELKQMGDYASSILGGAAGGALGGGLAAFGAYSGVMAAAHAGLLSAGGSALYGAAATNATLAFLGGGSLAASGLGMAGGAAVLGGLVAGPALAIMGFVVGAKAKTNLNKAYSNFAEAEKIAEELNTASVLCNGIRRRSYMFERLLMRLEFLFFPLLIDMEKAIYPRMVKKNSIFRRIFLGKPKYFFLDHIDWNVLSDGQQKNIAAVFSIAMIIKTVLDTPILTEDGKLTDESEQVANEVKAIVDKRETV